MKSLGNQRKSAIAQSVKTILRLQEEKERMGPIITHHVDCTYRASFFFHNHITGTNDYLDKLSSSSAGQLCKDQLSEFKQRFGAAPQRESRRGGAGSSWSQGTG